MTWLSSYRRALLRRPALLADKSFMLTIYCICFMRGIETQLSHRAIHIV